MSTSASDALHHRRHSISLNFEKPDWTQPERNRPLYHPSNHDAAPSAHSPEYGTSDSLDPHESGEYPSHAHAQSANPPADSSNAQHSQHAGSGPADYHKASYQELSNQLENSWHETQNLKSRLHDLNQEYLRLQHYVMSWNQLSMPFDQQFPPEQRYMHRNDHIMAPQPMHWQTQIYQNPGESHLITHNNRRPIAPYPTGSSDRSVHTSSVRHTHPRIEEIHDCTGQGQEEIQRYKDEAMKNLRKAEEALEKHRTLDDQILNLQVNLAGAEKETQNLKLEKDHIHKQHTQQIEQLEDRIAKLQHAHKEDVEAVRLSHDGRLTIEREELEKQFKQRVTELQHAHQKEVENARSSKDKTIAKLTAEVEEEREHSNKRVTELQHAHQKEVENARSSQDKTIAKLTAEMEEHRELSEDTIEKLRKRHEEDMEAIKESHRVSRESTKKARLEQSDQLAKSKVRIEELETNQKKKERQHRIESESHQKASEKLRNAVDKLEAELSSLEKRNSELTQRDEKTNLEFKAVKKARDEALRKVEAIKSDLQTMKDKFPASSTANLTVHEIKIKGARCKIDILEKLLEPLNDSPKQTSEERNAVIMKVYDNCQAIDDEVGRFLTNPHAEHTNANSIMPHLAGLMKAYNTSLEQGSAADILNGIHEYEKDRVGKIHKYFEAYKAEGSEHSVDSRTIRLEKMTKELQLELTKMKKSLSILSPHESEQVEPDDSALQGKCTVS